MLAIGGSLSCRNNLNKITFDQLDQNHSLSYCKEAEESVAKEADT